MLTQKMLHRFLTSTQKNVILVFGINILLTRKDISCRKKIFFSHQLFVDVKILSNTIYCITKVDAKDNFYGNFLFLASIKDDAKSNFSCSEHMLLLRSNLLNFVLDFNLPLTSFFILLMSCSSV